MKHSGFLLVGLGAGLLSACGSDATTLSATDDSSTDHSVSSPSTNELARVFEVMPWPQELPRKPGMFWVAESHDADGTTTSLAMDHNGNVFEPESGTQQVELASVDKAVLRLGYGFQDNYARCVATGVSCSIPHTKVNPWKLVDYGEDGKWEDHDDAFFGLGDALVYARTATAFWNYWDDDATAPNGEGIWAFFVHDDATFWGQPANRRGVQINARNCNYYGTTDGRNYCKMLWHYIVLFADNINQAADDCSGVSRQEMFEKVAVHEIGHAMGLGHWVGGNTAMDNQDPCGRPAEYNSVELSNLADYDPTAGTVTVLPQE